MTEYTNTHLLLLFGSGPPAENIAVMVNALTLWNSKLRTGDAAGEIFLNRPSKAALDVAKAQGTNQAFILLGRPGPNLSACGANDRLYMFGHGDVSNHTLSGLSAVDLARQLQEWGLSKVRTLYIYGCQMGLDLGDGRDTYALHLSRQLDAAQIAYDEIRAPRGYVKADQSRKSSEAGRKKVFEDEQKTIPIPKGSNKVVIRAPGR